MHRIHSLISSLGIVAGLLLMVMAPSLASVAHGDRRRRQPQAAVSTAADTARPALSYNDRRRYDYFFLEAVRQQNAGHYDAAFDLLSHCVEIDHHAAEAYYLLAMYHTELGNDSTALAYLGRAAELRPDNDIYQERVAQYFIGTNDYKRAISAYENLYNHHRDRSDILNVLLQLYRHEKDYNAMLRCLNLMEQTDGPSEETTMNKMRVYELKGDKKLAQRTLKSLVDAHPGDITYKVMLGNWTMQNGKPSDAYKLFSAAVDADPDNEYALSSMYDYYNQTGNDSLALRLRDRILLSPKTAAKTRATMLSQVIKDNEAHGGDSIKVLALIDRMQEATPRDPTVGLLKTAYMQLKKMPDDSVASALRGVLAIAPDEAPARLQLLQLYWPKKRWDDIIANCNQAVQYNPDELAFFYFLGMAYYQKDDVDAALDAFRRGASEINAQSDAAMASDFYALMGDILHQKGQDEAAFAAYDSCLQWKDDNLSCLNNYAYYLSTLNRELTKAEQMSYKTVKAEPNNATYLDTYAWILFQQKRYSEAKIYIDQAVRNDSDSLVSSVIIEHAGDIYAMNGEPDRAVEYWQKAIQHGGDKAVLSRKIRLRKYVAPDAPAVQGK